MTMDDIARILLCLSIFGSIFLVWASRRVRKEGLSSFLKGVATWIIEWIVGGGVLAYVALTIILVIYSATRGAEIFFLTAIVLVGLPIAVILLVKRRRERWAQLTALAIVAIGGIAWLLSQGTPEEQRIKQAYAIVCQGNPSNMPDVGTTNNQPRRAWFGGSEIDLPTELMAAHPRDFRYAVCLEVNQSVEIQRCSYEPSGLRIRKQVVWTVAVRDTRIAELISRKTFNGSNPSECPRTIEGGGTSEIVGSAPLSSEVVGWLKGILPP